MVDVPKIKINELSTEPSPALDGLTLPYSRNGRTRKVSGSAFAGLVNAQLEDRLTSIEASQKTGLIVKETWAALTAVIGAEGNGAEVLPADTGTHTDPVVGGTVPNAGRYVWSAGPAGWKWVTPDGFGLLAAELDSQVAELDSQIAEESARRLSTGHTVQDISHNVITATKDLMQRHVAKSQVSGEDAKQFSAAATKDLMQRHVAKSANDLALLQAYRTPVKRDGLPAAFVEIEDVVWSVSGMTITVSSGRSALKSGGRPIYFSGAVTIAPAASGSVNDEAASIIFASGNTAWVFAGTGKLDFARVSNVVVRDASTSAVLSATTDYALSAEQGAIFRRSAGSARAVLVDYDYSLVRYDLVEVALDGTISVKSGTDRNRDAAEYIPTRTAGRIPVLVVRATSSGITVWRWQDPEQSLLQAPAIRQRKRARNLGNFQRALRSGDPIVIAGYGDSRTNLGLAPASPYAANGAERDRMTSGFLASQGSDFTSAIPLYDHGDGAGAVHTHIGWNWDLKRAIEKLYPNAVSYLNFGIGGTSSGDTANGGLVPERLAGLTGSGATIATIAFGMNELGSAGATTLPNLVAIGEACIGAGIDPIFIAPARPNAIYAADIADRWLYENNEAAAAADYLAAPFVDTAAIFGVDRAGPLDPRECCTSNHFNHDSVFELGLIGRALASIVLDI